jgi:predicted membrane-bound mannosyltransferase
MDRDPHDAQFTTWFRELRADDARRTPSAQRFLDAAEAKKQGRLRRPWAPLATLAAAAVTVWVVVAFWFTPFAPRRAPTTQLWQWQPPTAQLLHPFSEELLTQTPQLGMPLTMNTEGTKN